MYIDKELVKIEQYFFAVLKGKLDPDPDPHFLSSWIQIRFCIQRNCWIRFRTKMKVDRQPWLKANDFYRSIKRNIFIDAEVTIKYA